MPCDPAIRTMIRPFLDDLLDEKDYQAVHAHMELCDPCRVYASSVGTLSHRLYELGQVTLPPDMVSTILYELKKQNAVVESPEKIEESVSRYSTNFFWTAAISLFAGAVMATLIVVGIQGPHKGNPSAVKVSPANMELSEPAVSDGQKIQTAVEKIKTTVYALDDGVPAESKLDEVRTILSQLKGNADLLAQWRPVHWHYHLSRSSQSELAALVRDLQLAIDHESSNYYIFYVSKGKLEEFKRRMGALSGVIKEFGDQTLVETADDSIQVSVYLE